MNERGKRQMHLSTSSQDDMDDREATDSFADALRVVNSAPNAIDHAKELRERDEERREMYESETGRTITLDLLAKGINPGPGKILHILPDPGDVVDEPSDEDIFSSPSQLPRGGGSMDGEGDPEQELDEADLDDIPDDDPEFQQFMNAFKASMGTDGFDSMLSALDKRLETHPGGSSNPMSKEGMANPFEMEDDFDDHRQATAQEMLSDVERGLVDVEHMDSVPSSPIDSHAIRDEIAGLKLKDGTAKSSNNSSSGSGSGRSSASSSSSSSSLPSNFDFDSIDLGDPNLLKETHLIKRKPKNPLLALLDNEPLDQEDERRYAASPSASAPSFDLSSFAQVSRDADGVIPESEVDRQWKFILFARCPDPDYSKPLLERRKENIARANGLYQDMLEQGIQPDVDTLTSYMSVYSEASKLDESINLIEKFASDHDLIPNEKTYLSLIRLHIFLKDINGAMARFHEMKERDLPINGKIYGTLIQSLTHRDQLVEALQLLEEASSKQIHISNTFIKKLRNRCEKLGVTHPDIPEDPERWVKEVKEFRKKTKSLPVGGSVHRARSMSYT
jgi:hypothetical protein